jgi:hypothetical protein
MDTGLSVIFGRMLQLQRNMQESAANSLRTPIMVLTLSVWGWHDKHAKRYESFP